VGGLKFEVQRASLEDAFMGGHHELPWSRYQNRRDGCCYRQTHSGTSEATWLRPDIACGKIRFRVQVTRHGFQAQHVDTLGRPLKIDGEIGPISWGSLFSVSESISPAGTLAQGALAKAISQIGVREVPIGSNRGPDVEKYLASTDLNGGFFWCMAFVHWCFMKAADDLGVANKFPKTAGVLKAWNDSSAFRITKSKAVANPDLIVPGSVFILDYGNGMGHTGIVKSSVNGALRTIEGNTNTDGSSNGIGVFELNHRSVMNARLKGFIIVP
jgi:hypothetical protein